jgi:CDP-diacylglycerol--glycerol-3-phosphate 3-phosphatidyltransferase
MANLITMVRFPLLIFVVLVLYSSEPQTQFAAVPLMGLLIALDTVDGVVARRRKEVSAIGSVLDIMADRAVELVMWICYADLRLVPVAIPIIYVLRGTIVDSLRSFRVGAGQAPFSAMRSKIGIWVVKSPFMRTSYGASKFVSFSGLALSRALGTYAAKGVIAHDTARLSLRIFNMTSWISVALCLTRGIPVVVEALSWPNESKSSSENASSQS